MKPKFIIDEQGELALAHWNLYNIGYTLASDLYYPEFDVYFKNHGDNIRPMVVIVEQKEKRIKMTLKNDKKEICVKAYVSRAEKDSGKDFTIEFEPVIDGFYEWSNWQDYIEYAVQGVLVSNAYLFYGNVAGGDFVKVSSKNSDDGKVIAFREYNGKVYAIETTAHRSPDGIFSVRGHFRKYSKTGKVIWIDEYLKGLKK